jgi:hypothetical protein
MKLAIRDRAKGRRLEGKKAKDHGDREAKRRSVFFRRPQAELKVSRSLSSRPRSKSKRERAI